MLRLSKGFTWTLPSLFSIERVAVLRNWLSLSTRISDERASDVPFGLDLHSPRLSKANYRFEGKKSSNKRRQSRGAAKTEKKPLSEDQARIRLIVYNKLINKHARQGRTDRMERVLQRIRADDIRPDVYTFATMMDGYCKAGSSRTVGRLFSEMVRLGIVPNDVIYGIRINACAETGDIAAAMQLYREMQRVHGLSPTLRTYGQLLKVCSKARDIETAETILDEIRRSGIKGNNIIYASIIEVYAESTSKDNVRKHLEIGWKIVESMKLEGITPNAWIYNTLIKLCNKGDLLKAALAVMGEMIRDGTEPDAVTYTELMNGYVRSKRLNPGEVGYAMDQILAEMRNKRIEPMVQTYTPLISAALVMRDLRMAKDVFSEGREKGLRLNAATYGVMIKCLEKLGNMSNIKAYLGPMFFLLREMKDQGFRIQPEVYVSLISACGNVGVLDSALDLWTEFRQLHEKPKTAAFCAMIKACLSVDDVTTAVSFMNQMEELDVASDDCMLRTLLLYVDRRGRSDEILSAIHKLKQQNIEYTSKTKELLTKLKML